MTLFTRTAKLEPGAHGARCAWAMVVHHAVGISRQRNNGYRPSMVNIMAQGLSTSDPSFSPTHFSIKRGRATTTHYTRHQVSLIQILDPIFCNWESYSSQRCTERCLMWPWPLISWPPYLLVSCPCLVDHLRKCASKWVYSFSRYPVHKLFLTTTLSDLHQLVSYLFK